jgi:dolichol-phosphate mannosyltransferase
MSDTKHAANSSPEHKQAALNREHIPTSDPEAALQFCRSLAALLDHDTNQAALYQNRPHSNPVAAQPGAPIQTRPELPPAPDISVVLPVYNETANIPTLHERLTAVLAATGLDYELIFVDDGSRDESAAMLREITTHDQHVLVVELARNFGHQMALSAGLEYTRGQGVIVMDSDLQDPPEVLPLFIERWREGYEVVYAIREHRKENIFKRAAYKLFYRILQRVAQIDIPLDSGDFCIMDRRVVDLLVNMPERNRFVRGIRSWVGFEQTGLAYERHARFAGKPKYNFRRLMNLALDGIISFSYAPLRAITLGGFMVSLLSIGMALFYAIHRVTFGLNPPGFPTLIVAIFFLSGVQLITLGVMGEYVGRIFEEVKHRPLYTVRRVTGIERRRERRSRRSEQVYAQADAQQ